MAKEYSTVPITPVEGTLERLEVEDEVRLEEVSVTFGRRATNSEPVM